MPESSGCGLGPTVSGKLEMKVVYSGREAWLSERERTKLQRKLDKIHRILTRRGGLEANVTLSRQRHLCEAEVTLRALRHTLVVSGTGVSAFNAMHAALEKLEKQAIRNKHKIIDTHRPGRQRDQPSVVVEDSIQRTLPDLPAIPDEIPDRPRIVPGRELAAKPMTAEEALLELESEKRPYISYRDADTGRINVLVLGEDGTAELVEGG